MKKNIGKNLSLYPTPLVVVGAMVDGKPNWTLVAHLGIIGHDHVMVSMAASHYSNKGIKENGSLSINLVDEAMLAKADHAAKAGSSWAGDLFQELEAPLVCGRKRRTYPQRGPGVHGLHCGGHLLHPRL